MVPPQPQMSVKASAAIGPWRINTSEFLLTESDKSSEDAIKMKFDSCLASKLQTNIREKQIFGNATSKHAKLHEFLQDY